MKASILSLTLVLTLGLLVHSTANAQKNTNLSQQTIIGIDTTRNVQIDSNSITMGQDALIARKATPAEAAAPNSFRGPNDEIYVPINNFNDLRALDKNKDGTVSKTELENSDTTLMTARYLEGTNMIIPENSILNEFTSIKLPSKPGEAAIVNIGPDNSLIMEELKIQK